MSHRLAYLSADTIERDAAQLLAEFAQARRLTLAPPIPIEDVIEKHLRLRIDFDDLHALHTVPRPASGETAVLGAIYGDGRIFVDESLDPEEHPSQENRYRFTLAHEGGGHWRLHRHLIRGDAPPTAFLGAAPAPESTCLTSQTTRRREWQANHYASCLLMPRPMIVAAWNDRFPDHHAASSSRAAPSIIPVSTSPAGPRLAARPTVGRGRIRTWNGCAGRWRDASASRRSRCASDWNGSACCAVPSPPNGCRPAPDAIFLRSMCHVQWTDDD